MPAALASWPPFPGYSSTLWICIPRHGTEPPLKTLHPHLAEGDQRVAHAPAALWQKGAPSSCTRSMYRPELRMSQRQYCARHHIAPFEPRLSSVASARCPADTNSGCVVCAAGGAATVRACLLADGQGREGQRVARLDGGARPGRDAHPRAHVLRRQHVAEAPEVARRRLCRMQGTHMAMFRRALLNMLGMRQEHGAGRQLRPTAVAFKSRCCICY